MRRSAVALGLSAALLALPAAALADSTVNLGTPSGSGVLKGPDVVLQYQIFWEDRPAGVLAREIRYIITPASGGTTINVSKSTGDVGLGSVTVPLNDGRYRIAARTYELLPGSVPVFGPVTDAGVYTVDSTPPGNGRFELAGGAPFTNRFTVRAVGDATPLIVVGGGGDSRYYEIRFDGQGFPGCSRTTSSALPDGSGCGGLTPPGPFRLSAFVDKEITLPAGPDGLRRVWIRFRDAAEVQCQLGGFGCLHDGDGNASAPVFDDIILDTTAPTITLAAGASPAGQAGAPLAFDAGPSSDATSGIDPASFTWDFKDGSPVVENAGPTIAHTYPGPGSYPGEVRGRDRAGNPGIFRFTAFVGVAPPAGGGDQGPLQGPGGAEPPPAQNAGGGGGAPEGGAGGGGAPAPPPPPVRLPRPKVLKVNVADERAFVNVNDEGVMRVRIETLKGRALASFTQSVDQGRNRLRVPRRLGPRIPDAGRLVLEMQVVADGVAGPVISRRIDAVALNPQPLPPKARAALR